MKIVPLSSSAVATAVKYLRAGGLVILPTETMYGAMVDATNTQAVMKLTKYKNRPFGKPYSIAVTDEKMAEEYVEVNETAKNLYKTFLPGPVTVISKGKHQVAAGVESETGTLGVRIPDYPMVREIVKRLGKPITATSANASYKKRPYQISDILDNLSEKQKRLINLIVDAGELPHNEPSTVVDTTSDENIILRQGDIKLKEATEIISRGEEGTRNMGKELWQKFENFKGQRAIVFALEGPIGAGKTQLVKGLAKAMGIEEEVNSPTFTLDNEYPLKEGGVFHHMDVWRMIEVAELEHLGWSKIITDKSIVAIEWADKVIEKVREINEEAVVVWISLQYGGLENERKIKWGTV